MGEVVKWHKQQAEVKAIQSAGGLEALKAQWLAEATGQPAVQSNGMPNLTRRLHWHVAGLVQVLQTHLRMEMLSTPCSNNRK